MVIGVSDAIHILIKYHENLNEDLDKNNALNKVIKEIGSALFLTSFTTAIGFFSLMLTNIRITKEFGFLQNEIIENEWELVTNKFDLDSGMTAGTYDVLTRAKATNQFGFATASSISPILGTISGAPTTVEDFPAGAPSMLWDQTDRYIYGLKDDGSYIYKWQGSTHLQLTFNISSFSDSLSSPYTD